MIKHILTDLLVPSALCWWAGVGTIDRLLTVSLVVVKQKKHWTEIKEKEPLDLKANPFPRNCTLPEITCVY